MYLLHLDGRRKSEYQCFNLWGFPISIRRPQTLHAKDEKGSSKKDIANFISSLFIEKTKLDGGRAKLLVWHDLAHDYDYLGMTYTNNIIRDATEARPLAKTNIVIYSLKYLIINI
jgi:hypothetical protein